MVAAVGLLAALAIASPGLAATNSSSWQSSAIRQAVGPPVAPRLATATATRSSSLASTAFVPAAFAPSEVVANASDRLRVQLDPAAPGGIFDPDLALTGPATVTLSYSAVVNTSFISTRLAAVRLAPDGSVLYQYLGDVNEPVVNTSVPCGSAVCPGNLVHEVSSLSCPTPDACLVLTHTYLVAAGDVLRYDLGFISLFTAPSLSGPWTATSWLGWDAGAPFSTEGVSQNLNALPPLASCLVFSEPSILAVPSLGKVLVALTCVNVTAANETEQSIVLLSTNSSASFAPVPPVLAFEAVLVAGSDMRLLTLNSTAISAANLFLDANNALFLTATPSIPLPFVAEGYFGCLTFPIVSGSDGALSIPRAPNGAPIPIRFLVPTTPLFNGACTTLPLADDARGIRYLLSTLFVVDNAPLFSILPTNVTAP